MVVRASVVRSRVAEVETPPEEKGRGRRFVACFGGGFWPSHRLNYFRPTVAGQGVPSRRQLLRGAVGGAVGIVLGATARSVAAAPRQSASSSPNIQRLKDDLFIITIPGEANVVARTAADGVVLVDGASARASDALMQAIATLPGGRPVQTIFNTHWHPEQTGSNEALGKAGKTIIAHENTRL